MTTDKKYVKKTYTKPEPKKAETLPAVRDVQPVQIVDATTLIKMAIEQGTGIDVLERLLVMRDKIQADESQKLFREALSLFQGECPIISKHNKVFGKDNKIRYKFASIDDIGKIVKPILTKYELSYDIETTITTDPPMINVTVTVFHTRGANKKSSFSVPIDLDSYMSAPQQWASAQTFAKRYAFCNALGILTGDEDNDANVPEKENKKLNNISKESIEKINQLPDIAKKGFGILGYTYATINAFCNKFGWDNNCILAEINRIVDMREKTKESV